MPAFLKPLHAFWTVAAFPCCTEYFSNLLLIDYSSRMTPQLSLHFVIIWKKAMSNGWSLWWQWYQITLLFLAFAFRVAAMPIHNQHPWLRSMFGLRPANEVIKPLGEKLFVDPTTRTCSPNRSIWNFVKKLWPYPDTRINKHWRHKARCSTNATHCSDCLSLFCTQQSTNCPSGYRIVTVGLRYNKLEAQSSPAILAFMLNGWGMRLASQKLNTSRWRSATVRPNNLDSRSSKKLTSCAFCASLSTVRWPSDLVIGCPSWMSRI